VPASGAAEYSDTTETEFFDAVDLALLRCPIEAQSLPFSFTPLPLLHDVISAGWPFGLELPRGFPHEPPMWHLRAFKGYVVTRRALRHLPAAPPGYEISFIPPTGLSGAPLIIGDSAPRAIAGIVLMHHRAVHGDRSMDLGLALDAEELLTLDSKILGGSIAEKLFGRARLVR
jgi:hypothetical protein